MKKNFLIPAELANKRIDQTLAILLPEHSRTEIKNWIENDLVLINGKTTKAKTKVKEQDEISVTIVAKPPITYEAQAIPLNIIYEDECILVINKPIGLIVHPGAGNRDQTLLNALLHYLPTLRELPRAGIIHRLDKDTSGLLIIAKNASALKSLQQQLKKRTMTREYQAIVQGSLISGGTVNAPIGRHPQERIKMSVLDSGKEAITHYRIIEKFKQHTHLKIRLETGRTHQIRVHMLYINHPIVGDKTYHGKRLTTTNQSEKLKACLRSMTRQALHAYRLEIDHPSSNERLTFKATLPEDMVNLIKVLREDMSKEL